MKNKKLFWLLILTIFLGLFFSSNKISASPSLTTKEDDVFSGGLLFGQSHFYSVFFRENGEAIVYSKIVVTNSNEEPLKEFSFEIPKVSPTEMIIYQMKLPQECVLYDYSGLGTQCLEYQDPDYTRRSYYYDYGYREGKIEYKRINFVKEGDLYSFEIPEEVESFKTTAFIIAYAAKGYVQESVGFHRFQFETIKVPSRIKESRVVVDVDRDLFMKGKRLQIDYPEFPAYDAREVGVDSVISNRELDKVVQSIGSYGRLVKEARNLAPNEVLFVKGEYAKSWVGLHLYSLIKAVLFLFSLFLGIHFLLKFLNKKKKITKEKNTGNWPLTMNNLLISLISALSVFAITIVLYIIDRSINFYFGYYYFFEIIQIIIIGLLYILIIFAPPIIISLKNGWKSFIVILGGEVLWMLIFLSIFFLFFQSNSYYY